MTIIRDRNLPRRALIVAGQPAFCDDATGVLRAASVEAICAADGEEALTLFARQSFPVIVTDAHMPHIDGLELVQRIRALAVAPVYVIMLSESSDAHEYERGYCAGVDHFIAKQNYARELVSRVSTGFVAMQRRHASALGRMDRVVMVDLASGAHTARHMVGRLHAEIALAGRRQGALDVLSVCIETRALAAGEPLPAGFDAAGAALLRAIEDAVRPRLDWIARLPSSPNVCRFAIVMPDAGAECAAVEQHVRNAFVHGGDAMTPIELTIGVVRLGDYQSRPTALELLGESERRRRGAGARAAPDLNHVQPSDDAPVGRS